MVSQSDCLGLCGPPMKYSAYTLNIKILRVLIFAIRKGKKRERDPAKIFSTVEIMYRNTVLKEEML